MNTTESILVLRCVAIGTLLAIAVLALHAELFAGH